MYVIYALLSAFFTAITVIIAKLGTLNNNESEPTIEATLRMLFSFLMLFFILFIKEGINIDYIKNISISNWLYIALSGISFGISSFFFYLALSKGDSTLIVALERSSVLLVAILGMIFLGEALTLQKIIGIALIMFGVIILSNLKIII